MSDYIIVYRKTQEEENTPHRSSHMVDKYVNFIGDNAVPKAMTLEEVQTETKKDSALCKVIQCLCAGHWQHAPPDTDDVDYTTLKALYQLQNELTVNADQNIILRGTRLVLPTSVHHKAINLAHIGHMGTVKTKQLLREKVWFPGIDDMVNNMIQHCILCQAATTAR